MPIPRVLRCLLLVAPLCGCAAIDPFTREGVWRPTGANEANLQAMLDNPQDLIAGRGASGSNATMAAQAVERLRTDRVRPLPASGIARIGQSGGGGGGAGAATPGY